MDYACRPEDGQSAQNAKARVPGLLCDLFAAGDRYGDLEVGGKAMFCAKHLDLRRHHGARDRIDGRLADADWQAVLRDCADAVAGNKADTASGPQRTHHRDYGRTMGHIRIVTGILDDAGHGIAFSEAFERERKRGLLSARKANAHRIGKLSSQERGQRRLGGRGRAGAGRPAATERTFRLIAVFWTGIVFCWFVVVVVHASLIGEWRGLRKQQVEGLRDCNFVAPGIEQDND